MKEVFRVLDMISYAVTTVEIFILPMRYRVEHRSERLTCLIITPLLDLALIVLW